MNTPSKPTCTALTRRVTRAICAASIAAFCSAHAADSFWAFPTSGSWDDATKWTTNPLFPNNGSGGVNYSAFINTAGTYTVSLATDITVDNFTLNAANATLQHTSGVFSVLNSASLLAGTYRLDGGAIAGGGTGTLTLAPTATLSISSNFNNRLDGVAVSGTVNFAEGGARVRLENGASLTGTANLTASGALLAFNQSGTVAAPLTINLDTDTFLVGTSSLVIEGSNAVTLGAGVTVRGQGSVGGQFNFGGTNALTNAGLISADVSDGVFGARTLTILSNNFTNEGTARAINGGTLSIPVGPGATPPAARSARRMRR